MSNPIDTNSFRHFLEIRGVKTYIQEPDNFDASNFKVVQDDIARDTYFGNEETQLEFYINYGKPIDAFMNNDGVLISHLPSGAELIIEENKNYGNEADVIIGLEKDNITFTIGNIDFNKDYDSDNKTFVKCRIIQNSAQALIKKREDITIDLLSTKDLDDNDITAIPVKRMFLKAKPTYGETEFQCPNDYEVNLVSSSSDNPTGETSSMFYFYNNCQEVINYGIEDTLSFLDQTISHNGNVGDDWDSRNDEGGLFTLIRAKEDLSNIKLNIKDLVFQQQGDSDNGGNGYAETYFVLRWGADINTPTGGVNLLYNFIDENGNTTQTITDSTYEIPYLPSGHRIWVYFRTKVRQSATSISSDARMECFSRINKYTINITATSTAISSVINAVRWIDLIKQNYKAIGSLPVNAQKYDVGGEFYDNFLFNKNLIRHNLTSPFYTKLKDVKEDLLEQCAYAQINTDKIHIGNYEDFYRNIDMGGFLEIPDHESSIIKNTKYLVNKFVFGYKKYEQDRAEKNTIDAIHTNSEWFVQANNSINSKEIKLPFLRDVFLIESQRRQIFSSKDTSTSDDDNIFKVEIVQLPPNSRNNFTRFLNYATSSVEGTFIILSDNSFRWDLLGFKVNDLINVNGVSHLVLNIETNLLTLNWISLDVNGADFFTIDYPLTDVVYTNRTNEGLIFSDNLRNANNFGNLRYSIKRNIKNWYAVLATYGKFIPGKKVKNTYFKANGEATTQFTGETEPIKENADIEIDDISNYKILSQDIYKTRVRVSFSQAEQLLKDIQNVRGFIRVQNPSGAIIKGYIKDADFVWANEELALTLEIKNESDFLTVTFADGILTINEVGYDVRNTTEKIYNIFNDYIQFFDENSINLCNRTKFDKVSLNGVTYYNIDNLVNALENL